MAPVTTIPPALNVCLGTGECGCVDPGLPVLGGATREQLFGEARPHGRVGNLQLFAAGDWLLGAAAVPIGTDLENISRDFYRDIFRATRGWHLARIWNYVPDINQTGPGGLENYRLFCRGRSLAFEEEYGVGFKAQLPSASAVGCKASSLTIAFAASRSQPHHHENPLQVPAYDYPVAYGPRAPSFARATVVPGVAGDTIFVSGTAAIRGHAVVAANSTEEQLACTLENLRVISRACGLDANLDQTGHSQRHFKIYVRHAEEQPLVAAVLEAELLTEADQVSYVQADICRAALCVEIEASLFGVTALR
jgi:chorismate lyase/3-hydroxybenzoate synthase